MNSLAVHWYSDEVTLGRRAMTSQRVQDEAAVASMATQLMSSNGIPRNDSVLNRSQVYSDDRSLYVMTEQHF